MATPKRDTADKPKIGRPTNYRPEYVELVVALGAQGWSKAEIALEIAGASYETLDRWSRADSAFREAMVRARSASLAWWEAEGRRNLGVRDWNGNLYRICMQRFPEYKQAALVEVAAAPQGVDLSKLSSEDRAALSALLQKAKLEPPPAQPYTVRADAETPPEGTVTH